MYWTPGPDNSSLISTENAVPSKPENREKIKYNVPISLALLDKNQRSNQRDIFEVFDSKALISLFSLFTKFISLKLLKEAIKGKVNR